MTKMDTRRGPKRTVLLQTIGSANKRILQTKNRGLLASHENSPRTSRNVLHLAAGSCELARSTELRLRASSQEQ